LPLILNRPHHARVPRQPREGRADQVRGKVGAHRVGTLLAHVVGLAQAVQLGHGGIQHADLVGAEQSREEQVAVTLELFDLLAIEFHDLSWWDVLGSLGNMSRTDGGLFPDVS
jgi:hypothetical protein